MKCVGFLPPDNAGVFFLTNLKIYHNLAGLFLKNFLATEKDFKNSVLQNCSWCAKTQTGIQKCKNSIDFSKIVFIAIRETP